MHNRLSQRNAAVVATIKKVTIVYAASALVFCEKLVEALDTLPRKENSNRLFLR